jgi:hypothetical protein
MIILTYTDWPISTSVRTMGIVAGLFAVAVYGSPLIVRTVTRKTPVLNEDKREF